MMFQEVYNDVMTHYRSGQSHYKASHLPRAINSFRRAESLLRNSRSADESEERTKENILRKLYMNLAVCYVNSKQPRHTCVACNELNKLNSLWNSGKGLFLNGKALRMLGQYDDAEKRLRKAMRMLPEKKEIKAELERIKNGRENRVYDHKTHRWCIVASNRPKELSEKIKARLVGILKEFKAYPYACSMSFPPGLTPREIEYMKVACVKENMIYADGHIVKRGNRNATSVARTTETTSAQAERTLSAELRNMAVSVPPFPPTQK